MTQTTIRRCWATKVTSYSEGTVIDASLGESAYRGLTENVVKAGV
jgi:hypothetical protein